MSKRSKIRKRNRFYYSQLVKWVKENGVIFFERQEIQNRK